MFDCMECSRCLLDAPRDGDSQLLRCRFAQDEEAFGWPFFVVDRVAIRVSLRDQRLAERHHPPLQFLLDGFRALELGGQLLPPRRFHRSQDHLGALASEVGERVRPGLLLLWFPRHRVPRSGTQRVPGLGIVLAGMGGKSRLFAEAPGATPRPVSDCCIRKETRLGPPAERFRLQPSNLLHLPVIDSRLGSPSDVTALPGCLSRTGLPDTPLLTPATAARRELLRA